MKHSHYQKDISHLKTLDVYRTCQLFNVTDPAIQHAVKKLLCAGQRGAKNNEQDYREAIDSINRALQMIAEDCGAAKPARAEELQDDDGKRSRADIVESLLDSFDLTTDAGKAAFSAIVRNPDGWIEWGGGECPFKRGVMIEYKLRNGAGDKPRPAGAVEWNHIPAFASSDIVAYRIAKDQA